MAALLGRDTLPEYWSYGVCEDGRVFFVNDETPHTTWLHPRSGEPVNSGHMIRSGSSVNKLAFSPKMTIVMYAVQNGTVFRETAKKKNLRKTKQTLRQA
ncbi:Pleckstrin homology domain-containing family A member 7 [Acipenser ruthenus]|uniref:Pleckstrin homology domain-containing family A member 7 n=1 Tax=Acipenser ruthenus TaxID=7906 RepID=A0A444U9D2_ACIRT|nr:Pleckstrin homology domain-containing family A member 7 [Acipenser ruthenus]